MSVDPAAELPPEVFTPLPPLPAGTPYRVTAIVSAYRSTRFLRACLEDLLGQTLHARGELEVIVVDTGSPEDEAAIVRAYQARSPHLRYLRTEDRRTLYAAWNLGILASRGRYLTSANSDDRHHPAALERLADHLDRHPATGLVVADQIWTPVENETLATTTSRLRCRWRPCTYPLLRCHCMLGPQPMWRRALHQAHGLFDPTFTSAGDWDFWLRACRTERVDKIDEILGLYLVNRGGLELGSGANRNEGLRILARHGITRQEMARSTASALFEAWPPPTEPGARSVSVVLPAPPAGGLERALEHIAAQTAGAVEVVVADAAGSAGEAASAWRSSRLPATRRVTGPTEGAALRAAVAAARATWIVLVGRGDLLAPRFVERTLASLEATPMAAIAFADREDADGSQPGAGDAAARIGTVPATAVVHRSTLRTPWPDEEGDPDALVRSWLASMLARGIGAIRVPEPLVAPAALPARRAGVPGAWRVNRASARGDGRA